MEITLLRIPVACPECAKEVLAEFSMAGIAESLSTGLSIRLFAPCHDKVWLASDVEREQFRQYLEATNGYAAKSRASCGGSPLQQR
jgi:hypothetical protein